MNMKKVLKNIFIFFAYIINKIFFYKKGIIFSQANSRFSGNSKYLFLYLAENKYPVYWLYSDIEQKNKIPNAYRHLLINRKSIKGLYYILKSKYFVISYGQSDLGLYWHFSKYNIIINLWHGICIKKIALADVKFNSIGDHYKKTESKYYNYITVSSDIDMFITSSSHNVDIRNVLVTGNPRTDNYLKNSAKKSLMPNEKKNTNILYAPTFRDYDTGGPLFFPFKDFLIKDLDLFIKKNNDIVFYMRPHPSDKKSIEFINKLNRKHPKNFINYSVDVCDDIDENLEIFDLIITDYSSIYIEPLLSDTPCIFIPYDYDKYIETRGLAYDYDEITPGDKVLCFKELLKSIDENINNVKKWQSEREKVKKLFFSFIDTNSCKRITMKIFD